MTVSCGGEDGLVGVHRPAGTGPRIRTGGQGRQYADDSALLIELLPATATVSSSGRTGFREGTSDRGRSRPVLGPARAGTAGGPAWGDPASSRLPRPGWAQPAVGAAGPRRGPDGRARRMRIPISLMTPCYEIDRGMVVVLARWIDGGVLRGGIYFSATTLTAPIGARMWPK